MKDWEIDLIKNIHMFSPVKRVWQPDEMALAYRIYNGHYGTALRDTGCGSCRRSVLAHCLKIVENYRNLPDITKI
jgi:hypothetical protein